MSEPIDMIAVKEEVANLASAIRAYFIALKRQGFTDAQALALTVAWQTSMTGNSGGAA